MQKAIALLGGASLLLSSLLLAPSPALAVCAMQYPIIGTIGSITSQNDYTQINLQNADTFNASTLSTDHTNIDAYNAIASAYKQNGNHLPAALQYPSQGNIPNGYASWSDYYHQNYNHISVNTTALNDTSYHTGDIVIMGPPGGGSCILDGFVGFFGTDGVIHSAIASDSGYANYTYGAETLSLSPGAGYACTDRGAGPFGGTRCSIPINYVLNGNTTVVKPAETKPLSGFHFGQVALVLSSHTTLPDGLWVEDFDPVELLHVLTFNTTNTAATFNASRQTGSAPLPVSFTGTVPSNGYLIDFGDGSDPSGNVCTNSCTSITISTNHTYTAAGVYTAQLKADGRVVGSLTITVGDSTNARLSISGVDSPTSVVFGRSANWTVHAASATTTDTLMYSAVWGDGSTSTRQASPTLTHTFSQAGTLTAKFVVFDATSLDSATSSVAVTVSDQEDNGTPNDFACPALTTTLGRGMTDAQTNGQVTLLQQFLVDYFNLGDGTITGYFGAGNEGVFETHTMNLVNLFQTRNGISPAPYVGPLTRAAILQVCADRHPGNFSFTAAVSRNNPLAFDFTYSDPNQGDVFNIDYGDGNVGSLVYNVGTNCAAPAGCAPRYDSLYTYQQPGIYTAILTQVIDPCRGNPLCRAPVQVRQVATTTVTAGGLCNGPMDANCPPPNSFTATPMSGAAQLPVTFEAPVPPDYNLDNPNQYQVDFGDGNMAPITRTGTPEHIVLRVTHTYNSAGTYAAKFIKKGFCNPMAAQVGCVSVSPDAHDRILAQVTITVTGAPGDNACVVLTHNLYADQTDATTGGDVTKLQNFLIANGYLSGNATGYFGPMTLRAVQGWQAANGVVTSGTPDTTGFGYVGPKTRAAMAQGCNNTSQFSATPTSGPAQLPVRFTAHVPDASSGAYSVSFGDGQSGPITPDCSVSPGGDACLAIGTASHTYTSAGTYTAKLMRTNTCDPRSAQPGTCTGQAPQVIGTITITVTSGASSACVNLTHNIFLDQTDATTGGDVTTLQNFLAQVGYLTVSARGFFGPATLQAVQQWQAAAPQNQKYGLPSSGDPDTTGFGYVGLKTRGAIKGETCGDIVVPPQPPVTGPFSASPTSGGIPLTVTFNLPYISQNADLDFGDGSATTTVAAATCTGACPQRTLSHTYNAAGTYTAQLTQATSSVVCTGVSYDPNNPLSFLNIGTGTCINSPSVTVLGKVSITAGTSTSTEFTATSAGVNVSYNPWAIWVVGTHLRADLKAQVWEGNNQWGGDIPLNISTDGTFVTFGLPSNDPPSHCNATASCTVRVRLIDPANGRTSAFLSVTLPPVQQQPGPDPTASLTANGRTDISLNIGDPVNYTWNSQHGASAQSTISKDGGVPATWGPGFGDSLNGAGSNPINPVQAGHTYVITYLVTGTSGRTATSSVTIHVANTSNTAKTNFINGLYTCIEGRNPSYEEYLQWYGQTTVGTFYDVFHTFFTSPEYVAKHTSNLTYVTQEYNCVLGRAPESEGLANHYAAIQAGRSRDLDLWTVVGSPEFQTSVGPALRTSTGYSLTIPTQPAN